MSRSRVLIVSVFSVIVALVAVAAFWYLLLVPMQHAQDAATNATTTYSSLLVTNTAFAQATALAASGNYAAAVSKYREALALAGSRAEAAQIEMKLGQALEYGNDINGAIDVFQSIAKNKTYSNLMRAYGAENLGLLYDAYGNDSARSRTFSVDPFNSMATTSVSLSYRHLYEYATSFFPLANSELHIADYYATQLVRNKRGIIKLPDDTVSLFGKIIKARIDDANKDIPRIQSDGNEVGGLPDILKRKAVVFGKLAEVGTISTTTAQNSYRQALNAYAVLGPGEDGYVRYYYAAYLSAVGAPDSGVQLTLAPFYESSMYHGSAVESFFAGERNDTLNQKQVLQRLASIDAKFKASLISLGWQQSDF